MIQPIFNLVSDSYALLTAPSTEKVDVIITDPPYDAHVQNNMMSGGNAGTVLSYAREVAANFDPLTSYGWLPGAIAKARRWSIFFCGLEQLGYYRDASHNAWVRSGIYIKIRAMPQMTGDRPGNRCEGMSIFHGTEKKRWNGKGSHAFWESPEELHDALSLDAMPEDRKTTLHPTAKPLMLCMRLVELFSDPGELVFDPFCGTGNIGIACMLLDRRYVGLDNDPIHVANANGRAILAGRKAPELLEKFRKYKEKRP